MSTLYEYSNASGSYTFAVYGAIWKAQTFTPATAHTITSVKLFLIRVGSAPGTLTVSIRVADGSGHPTGADLCSGTINGNAVVLDPDTWYEITLGAGYALIASTKYAIVIRALTGNASNYIGWNASTDVYASGNREDSGDSGATWTATTIRDFRFEDWGVGAPTQKSVGSGSLTLAGVVAKLCKKSIGSVLTLSGVVAKICKKFLFIGSILTSSSALSTIYRQVLSIIGTLTLASVVTNILKRFYSLGGAMSLASITGRVKTTVVTVTKLFKVIWE